MKPPRDITLNTDALIPATATKDKVLRWGPNDWRVMRFVGKDIVGNFRFTTLSRHASKRAAIASLLRANQPSLDVLEDVQPNTHPGKCHMSEDLPGSY